MSDRAASTREPTVASESQQSLSPLLDRLQALRARIHKLLVSVRAMLVTMETETEHSAEGSTEAEQSEALGELLQNYSLLSGELSTALRAAKGVRVLQSTTTGTESDRDREGSGSLSECSVLPVRLTASGEGQSGDLEGQTEGRLPSLTADRVPVYLGTRPEPSVEQLVLSLLQRGAEGSKTQTATGAAGSAGTACFSKFQRIYFIGI